MLTAQLKTGEKICLGYDFRREELLTLRKKEEFFCPLCGERVILKLGDQRIFHFAHIRQGYCDDFYERESIYHLAGKRQLFQWLLHQRIPSILEFYDHTIQQRPDVLFIHDNKKYALEFQCSVISEQIFMKRTKTYLENGYIPIWILAGNQLQQKKQNGWSLSNFHYLFIKETTDGKYYIPTFCPDQRLFNFIGPILSYSVKNAFAPYSLIHRDTLQINFLVNPTLNHSIKMEAWHREVDFYHYHWSLYRRPERNRFLQEIYTQNLNPFLLPPEIGLPVYHSIFIQNSPIVWQIYFYLDVLSQKQPGEYISFFEVERRFHRRIARREVVIRRLPQFKEANPMLAIIEYMYGLAKLGYLEKKETSSFKVLKNLVIPKNNRDMEECKKLFYKKISDSQND